MHLLVYLHLSGIRSGYLFPSKKALTSFIETPPEDFRVTEDMRLPYDSYQAAYKKICKSQFDRSGPFGSHTNRKTAYLLAIWGGGKTEDMMQSARHKSQESSMRYSRDSSSLLVVAEKNSFGIGIPRLKFNPPFILNVQMAKNLNRQNWKNTRALHILARNYVVDLCHVNIQLHSYTPNSVLEACLRLKRQPSEVDKVRNFLNEFGVPEPRHKELFSIIASMEMKARAQEEREPVSEVAEVENIPEVEEPTPMVPKRMRGGSVELLSRQGLKNCQSSMEKVELLLACAEEANVPTKELAEPARQFTVKILHPFLRCFRDHFQSDKDRFVEFFGNFQHSKLKKMCQEKCGPFINSL